MTVKPVVMLVASEFWPLAKTGGLGDMVYAIATSLRDRGFGVRVMIPGYRSVLSSLADNARTQGSIIALGYEVDLVVQTLDGIEIVIARCDPLYDRSGNIYLEDFRKPWIDNAQRFGVLCHAAASIANGHTEITPPDILHLQDWHAGLTPAYLDRDLGIPVVLTVQNFMYQGRFPKRQIIDLDLGERPGVVDAAELFSGFSFLQVGLQLADVVTTVSSSYVKEIQVGGRFNWYYLKDEIKDRLVSIINWPETRIWNPTCDGFISTSYGVDSLERRGANRDALERRLNWAASEEPILATLSRITKAKGFGFLFRQVGALLERGCRLIIAGEGDRPLVNAARNLAATYPGRVALMTPYNESDARLVLSGSDGLLMPSLTEPCGLSQQHAQLYGCVPIVARAGGLPDTVTEGVTGFIFEPSDRASFLAAVDRFLSKLGGSAWQDLQRNCMRLHQGRAEESAYADLLLRICKERSEKFRIRSL